MYFCVQSIFILQYLILMLCYMYILQQVHILGASLGAFLAQKVAERTYKSPRVHSLLLCNGFVDTTAFKQTKTAKA